MNICYAITRNYQHKIIPSVRSLIDHNPKAKVYIVTEGDFPHELPTKPTVIDISDQEWFPSNGINYSNRFTYINYIKLVYASLLKVNKVIHLDADTIINDSLEPFWKTDVTGKWVAAVPEYKGTHRPYGPTYYNMGVCLYNLAQIRKDGIEDTLVDYVNKVRMMYPDQDVINKFGVPDKFTPVDVRYNECFCTGKTDNPAIIHYCSIWDWYERRHMDRREYLDKYMR